jgi:hypothetical protein
LDSEELHNFCPSPYTKPGGGKSLDGLGIDGMAILKLLFKP